ncbi:hypothetical protein AYJ10_18625 [Serratia marcescens]|nr:hypothetical protein AYJ10_18625 [Serratia marcescens]
MKRQTPRAKITTSIFANRLVTVTVRAAGRQSRFTIFIVSTNPLIQQVITTFLMVTASTDKIRFPVILNSLSGLTFRSSSIDINIRTAIANITRHLIKWASALFIYNNLYGGLLITAIAAVYYTTIVDEFFNRDLIYLNLASE